MNAVGIDNEYPIARDWTDPETGHRWIHLPMNSPYDYDQVKALPKVLEYDGDTFKRTGWNSDKGEVYYRNHFQFAKGA